MVLSSQHTTNQNPFPCCAMVGMALFLDRTRTRTAVIALVLLDEEGTLLQPTDGVGDWLLYRLYRVAGMDQARPRSANTLGNTSYRVLNNDERSKIIVSNK